MYASDARQLGLKMQHCAPSGVVHIEIPESPSQQREQFGLPVIALGTNLDQLHKISRRLRAKIVAANSRKRILEHHFCESVQIRPSAARDLNLCLEKQVQLTRKRSFRAPRAFGN